VVDGSPVDAVIVNTCTVTEQATVDCRKLIRRALRTSPNAMVAVTGCHAQLFPEELASLDGVRGVFGTAEKGNIAQHLEQMQHAVSPVIVVDETSDDMHFTAARTADADARTRAFLKLQDGCDYSCTFCTIPLARGGGRSMEFASIRAEVEAIIADGFQEIVLTGVNLGEYTAPTGERFVDVCRLLAECAAPIRVRLSSIEPNTLTPEVIDVIASSDVFCHHLHIPLQSGSAELLKHMRRRYNPAMYAETIRKVHERMPHAGLGIDVIVGFPGETEDHVRETESFLRSLPFTYLHVFTYSQRANTPAATMGEQVPMAVRRERTARLRTLSDDAQRRHLARHIGLEQRVVPEGYDPVTGRWRGWTDTYIRAEYTAPADHPHAAARVLITDIDHERQRGIGTLVHSFVIPAKAGIHPVPSYLPLPTTTT
jgi:threonylcarbamoyladenosine tRNA methylthiotransferase MtaB